MTQAEGRGLPVCRLVIFEKLCFDDHLDIPPLFSGEMELNTAASGSTVGKNVLAFITACEAPGMSVFERRIFCRDAILSGESVSCHIECTVQYVYAWRPSFQRGQCRCSFTDEFDEALECRCEMSCETSGWHAQPSASEIPCMENGNADRLLVVLR